MAEVRNLKKALDDYELASGQIVNKQKSSLFFFNILEPMKNKIARIIGCRVESIPSIYLGLPLGTKPPNSFWNSLIDRFRKISLDGKVLSLVKQVKFNFLKLLFRIFLSKL